MNCSQRGKNDDGIGGILGASFGGIDAAVGAPAMSLALCYDCDCDECDCD